MSTPLDKLIPNVLTRMTRCESCHVANRPPDERDLISRSEVVDLLEDLVSILFPGCHRRQGATCSNQDAALRRAADGLRQQCRKSFEHQCSIDPCPENCDDCGDLADRAVVGLLKSLPEIMRLLQEDITAAYEGDPAAKSTLEVVMSYPGIYAVTVHRIAHCLYQLKVPLIPRVMAEHAHSKTGIDIHPGASIGPGFFIDHGTGVVIGETCRIGRRVKIYQGVTLGALSFEKDENGNIIKGIQRHPQVEDYVVIYAGATILGGRTVIGAHTEIGGNVWLTHSVPPRSKVYNQQPRPLIRAADGRWKHTDGKPWDNFGAGI